VAARDVTVRVEGLNNLVRSLDKASAEISDLKEAHKAAGEIVVRDAQVRVPRRSGALAGTIRSARQARRARVNVGTSKVPYAGPIHWGWPARNIVAQPFAAIAAQATEPSWTEQYRRAVEAALAKVRGI
jgi:hypothetical protein